MRAAAIISGALAALALSVGSAFAGDVVVRPLAVAPEMLEKFADTYGEREIAILQDDISRALTRRLAKSGHAVSDNGPVVVEITLLKAVPNRPTFQQSRDNVGLDVFRSFGVGGASLEARVIGASGATIATVEHSYFETDISWAQAASTWTDARRSFHRFAEKVADAVDGQAAG
jgi:hypothetical protein